MEKQKLKVGDMFYVLYQGEIHHRQKIVRITQTQAISGGGEKFRILYGSNGEIDLVDQASFSGWRFLIESQELKEKYERAMLIYHAEMAAAEMAAAEKLESLSNDDLKLILNILNK